MGIRVKRMITKAEQIFDYAHIWREATYNFPFWEKNAVLLWDDAFLMQLKKVETSEISLHEHYLGLMGFVSQLDDGQSTIVLPKTLVKETGYYPVKIRKIGNEWVLIDATKEWLAYLYQPILAINGVAIDEFLAKLAPFVWHHRQTHLASGFNQFANFICDGKALLVEFESGKIAIPNQSTYPIFAAEKLQTQQKMFLIASNKYAKFFMTDEQVAYIQIDSFLNSNVVELFYQTLSRFQHAPRIIFDLRGTRNGNEEFAKMIAQAFFNDGFQPATISYPYHDSRLYAESSYQDFSKATQVDSFQQALLDSSVHQAITKQTPINHFPQYQGRLGSMPVTILVDEHTYGAGEAFVLAFASYKRALILGSPTAGALGKPLFQRFKSGGGLLLNTKHVSFPNGQPLHNIGIQPTLEISNTLEDYQNNRDFLLNKAFSIV